jgi:hypothetical protein
MHGESSAEFGGAIGAQLADRHTRSNKTMEPTQRRGSSQSVRLRRIRMPNYKALKSVAHNLGHSYLSLMNHEGVDYVVEHLFKTARRYGITHVEIDVLNGSISPAELSSPRPLQKRRLMNEPVHIREGAFRDVWELSRVLQTEMKNLTIERFRKLKQRLKG